MNTETALRFARQIQLGEVGPEGQARIGAARVVVAGENATGAIAAMYLRAAGVGSVDELRELPGDEAGWRAALAGSDVAVRADFDDETMVGLGVPIVATRAPDAGAGAVVAGTLAAAEVLQILLRAEPSPGFARKLHLSADGAHPILQRISAQR